MEANADPKLILTARLLADPQYGEFLAPESAREQAFRVMGGGSRATYHRCKAELLAKRGTFDLNAVETIKLKPCRPDLRYLAMLDRQQQLEQMRQQLIDKDLGHDGQIKVILPSDTPLHRLHKALNKAIKKENYKEAAKLRDQIHRFEKGTGEEGG